MKIISFIVVCFSFLGEMFAQTYYYKLSSVIKNGATVTNVSGGQFITFSDKICYESDKNGYTVGNGSLSFKSNDNGIAIYYGNSYWGSRTIFRFKNSKSELHVESSNGEQFIYKRMSAPAGVNTSSLIASQSSSGGSSTYSMGCYYPTTPVVSTYSVPTTSSGSRTATRTNTAPTRHTCSLCHGSGTIVRESNIATYGKDTQRYCSTCGRNYWASSGHSHVTCSQCHGKGYVETQ